ncbi:MAG: PD-(D/E)XK nuclease family protein [Gammaproteobacteria bacterium]|nr:PD-(D/E)XK nuclease family protein [Gammaproteobacteria bacterium]
MSSLLINALETGATVLTVNRRLARHVRQHYADQQQAQGKRVWQTPQVLLWTAWVEQCWDEIGFVDPAQVRYRLLTDAQAEVVWESVIRDSAVGQDLLSISATVHSAMQAWRTLKQWRLNVRDLAASDQSDVQAFCDWAHDYERRCVQKGWLDPALLPELLIDELKLKRISLPSQIIWFGFDDVTPQQQALIGALRQAGVTVEIAVPEIGNGKARRVACAESAAELRKAALWVRDLLERGERRVAVVVPDLAGQRARLFTIFDEVLCPARLLEQGPEAPRPYNVSLGVALQQLPVVASALAILELASGTMPLEAVGRLLLSPHLGAAESEMSRRALLDARLRRHGEALVSLRTVLRMATALNQSLAWACPQLARNLTELRQLLDAKPNRLLPSQWVEPLSQMLRAMGWPGERSLNSDEYQAVAAWKQLLAQFAALDEVSGKLSLKQTLSRLQQAAKTVIFQSQTTEQPVQVLGLLEAAGLDFDHVWVAGLHDEVWPPVPQPNPFLPISLQRRLAMPHASAERELEFARKVTARLLSAAPEVIVSYPQREQDRELRASPLLVHLPEVMLNELQLPEYADYRALIRNNAVIEHYVDSNGPALAAGSAVAGGSGVFRDQAACPFRAFGRYRLGAQALEVPASGLSAAERGSLLHSVLELIWQRLQDQQQLLALDVMQRREFVTSAVDQVLAVEAKDYPHVFTARFTALEQERLVNISLSWLEQEAQRPPFNVVATEQKRKVNISGLEFEVKADRIDRLADGGAMIIDYKTARPRIADWFGTRPDEPQLPLYAVTHDESVEAVAFAWLSPREQRFIGLSCDAEVAPGIERFNDTKYDIGKPDWESLQQEWRQVLERLAAEFRHGVASVDPKKGPETCMYCDLAAFCRINEIGYRVEEESASDEGESND